jgi:hypothetical protein
MAFNGTGSNVTSLNASNISSGTVNTARLGSGTANNTTFLRGDSTYAGVTQAPNPLHGVQTFTSSGTFNVPTGVTNVKVTVIGAGGNGGNASGPGCNTTDGGGGGAGGYVVDYVGVTSGGTATVTVGTSAGTRTTSFAGATTLTASGGSNGTNASGATRGNLGASGASTIFGLTNYMPGAARDDDDRYEVNSQIIALTSQVVATSTASSWNHGLGAAGTLRVITAGATNQHIAIGYGCGGGGGNNVAGITTGGAGGDGVVIVEW